MHLAAGGIVVIRLAVVRHCSTVAGGHKAIYNRVNPDQVALNRAGVRQAQSLGAALCAQKLEPRVILGSPSVRCQQTIEIVMTVMRGIHFPAKTLDGLRAQGWGQRGFVGREELMETWSYPDGFLRSRFPGGESGWEVERRVAATLRNSFRLLDGFAGDALIVTHGAIASLVVLQLLGLPADVADDMPRIPHGCGAILVIPHLLRFATAHWTKGIWCSQANDYSLSSGPVLALER